MCICVYKKSNTLTNCCTYYILWLNCVWLLQHKQLLAQSGIKLPDECVNVILFNMLVSLPETKSEEQWQSEPIQEANLLQSGSCYCKLHLKTSYAYTEALNIKTLCSCYISPTNNKISKIARFQFCKKMCFCWFL